MGLVLLCIIWLITIVSTYFFIAKTWWLPVGASASAAAIDHQFAVTYVLMGIIFVAAQMVLGYLVWKYRDHASADKADYSHGNFTLEIIWTALTAVLFPGPDGKLGITKPELEDPSAGGEAALGLDPADPASKDDVVTGIMEVPVNREVEVILRAHDVIHSFFVPAMRFKQDAVPGLAIHMHFTPTQTGDYEIACAELCGLGHYKMHGMLKVVSQDEFDKWLAAREAEKQ